jgi:hypothetical protein
MLLVKRKEKVNASPAVVPRPPRYVCVAVVTINGFEGKAILKNISISGFLMKSRTYAAITVGEHHTIQLKPEAVSGIKTIELEVEVRWIQSAETCFSSGFLIVKNPSGRFLEKYIDYIKTRS